MSQPVAVERVGEDCLRISGLSPRSIAQRELVTWLQARQEVASVAQRKSGSLEVRYRDLGAAGSFPRSLQDHLFTRGGPVAPRAFSVTLVHELPGRVRLRCEVPADEDVLRLAAFLSGQPGVLRASGSPASRTVVVVFDEALLTPLAVLALAGDGDRSTWPAAEPPRQGGRLKLCVEELNTVLRIDAVDDELSHDSSISPEWRLFSTAEAEKAWGQFELDWQVVLTAP